MAADADIAIVGGGFYGCCLALFLRSVVDRVVLFERDKDLMGRASAANQARIHMGYHYPRSFMTALRSKENFPTFLEYFANSVVDDFLMLYAVGRHKSKVSAHRFARIFQNINAPLQPAGRAHRALFDQTFVEEVFACKEYAFDWTLIRAQLERSLDRAKVNVLSGAWVTRFERGADDASVTVVLADDRRVSASTVFNASYSQINGLLLASGMCPIAMKHEWAEIALGSPPPDLAGLAVTMMDGPYFSTMPYPAAKLYSLTHVRYTPHCAWIDRAGAPSAYEIAERLPRESRWYHMVADARRYLPCMDELRWKESLFEVKSVLSKNEGDDGRPILFHRHPEAPRIYSVMGGKFDNIFDLFRAITHTEWAWRGADMRYLRPV